MKKRFFSILLSLCMVLMLLPVTAFAETPSEKYALYIVFDHGTLDGKQSPTVRELIISRATNTISKKTCAEIQVIS